MARVGLAAAPISPASISGPKSLTCRKHISDIDLGSVAISSDWKKVTARNTLILVNTKVGVHSPLGSGFILNPFYIQTDSIQQMLVQV